VLKAGNGKYIKAKVVRKECARLDFICEIFLDIFKFNYIR